MYRSVSWREPLLGGGDEYFDPAGRLIAAYLFTDYFAYCNGRSFTQKFGTIPPAPRGLSCRTCAAAPSTHSTTGRNGPCCRTKRVSQTRSSLSRCCSTRQYSGEVRIRARAVRL